MKKNTIIMVTTIVILCGVLLVIGLGFQDSIDGYLTLESDLVEATQSYVKLELKNQVTDTLDVKIEDLIKKGYIDESLLNVGEDTCDGSVLVIKSFDTFEYEANIKCKNYRSDE